jgi:hypothetical protein
MTVITREIDQPVVEGAQSPREALPLLVLLGILFLSPLLFDLAQRVVGRG